MRPSFAMKLVNALFILSCALLSTSLSAAVVTNEKIDKLDSDFQAISGKIYRHLAKRLNSETYLIKSIDLLYNEVRQYSELDEHIFAISLITKNIATINNNIDDQSVFFFISLLLKHNQFRTADSIYKTIKNDGDKLLVSSVSFIFAKYYLKRNKWHSVIELLDGAIQDLADEDENYALLINGIALQRLKKHRIAIKYYGKIPETSKYYSPAKLNIAIANIRQGWWTDAHVSINQLLSNEKAFKTDDDVNRLYLVLGYSLLQNEYYRDSRDTFRNIGLKSRYTNRALLGISLSATGQGDYVGALNALSVLRGKKTLDISVDESYLLLSHIYEKLKQNVTATASYTEGLDYYKNRINSIEAILRSGDSTNLSVNSPNDKYILEVKGNSVDLSHKYPGSFIQNYSDIRTLIEFISDHNSAKLTNSIDKLKILYSDYSETYRIMVNIRLRKRIAYLQNYMNQSRYGLARLYDNSALQNN